jgi:hypothetical protein
VILPRKLEAASPTHSPRHISSDLAVVVLVLKAAVARSDATHLNHIATICRFFAAMLRTVHQWRFTDSTNS